MHPALSVIFFTTASGAGYGLLALLGLCSYQSIFADGRMMVTGLVIALVLITFGLLSSTFHLGHPERAWRALTQWRSSWLSREGVLAVLVYMPASVLLVDWLVNENPGSVTRAPGLLVSILAMATVFATAMIYASLRAIPAWFNYWVPVVYLSLSISTGLVLLNALLAGFGHSEPRFAYATTVMIALAAITKWQYWRSIRSETPASSVQTAIGARPTEQIRLVQSPHTQQNYLQQEMGFQIARKHAERLRTLCMLFAFAIPALLCLTSAFSSGMAAKACGLFAVAFAAIGVVVERWLFFAEARHTVILYYGAVDVAQHTA